MRSGERLESSEYSTIGSAIALSGAISAAAILDDPEVRERTELLLSRIRWDPMVFRRDGRTFMYWGY